ncbi:MAG: TadE/TadG family type IV pilus assembly protein [Candidatus Nanopelagicales bacterium]
MGGAMVEFAVTLPVVVMMTLGAADFGRLFMESAVLSNASAAGAVFAYRTTKAAANLAGAEAAVLNNVKGLDSISASVTKLCDCPSAPRTWVSCSSTCTGYGSPRIYVRSSAIQSFDTLGVYPGVPEQVDMTISTWLRVQ